MHPQKVCHCSSRRTNRIYVVKKIIFKLFGSNEYYFYICSGLLTDRVIVSTDYHNKTSKRTWHRNLYSHIVCIAERKGRNVNKRLFVVLWLVATTSRSRDWLASTFYFLSVFCRYLLVVFSNQLNPLIRYFIVDLGAAHKRNYYLFFD